MNLPKPKLPPLKFCRAAYSPVYHPFYVSKVVLDDKTHPFYLPTAARWDARPRVGLWWHATGNTMLGKKAVVRRWCGRRLKNAFREALEERGFDEDGKGLFGGALTGCLEMDTKEGIVKAKFEEVKREAGMVVEHVMKMCQRGAELNRGSDANRGKWRMPMPSKLLGEYEPLVRKTVGTVPIQFLHGRNSQHTTKA